MTVGEAASDARTVNARAGRCRGRSGPRRRYFTVIVNSSLPDDGTNARFISIVEMPALSP